MTKPTPFDRQPYTAHQVGVGRSLFRPRPGCRPFRARTVAVQLVLGEDAWWSLDDWWQDRDYYDWNKGPGITSAFWRNNVNAAYIGWRPKKNRPGEFEVCSYVNDQHGKWYASEQIATVKARQAVVMTITLTADFIFTDLQTDNARIRSGGPWRQPWYDRYRWSGLSIGGANNAPGSFGGRAHKPMTIYSAVTVTKKPQR